jgi:hypothetical protein
LTSLHWRQLKIVVSVNSASRVSDRVIGITSVHRVTRIRSFIGVVTLPLVVPRNAIQPFL